MSRDPRPTLRGAIISAAKRRARLRNQRVHGDPNHALLRQARHHETEAISFYRELLQRLGDSTDVDQLIRAADPHAGPEDDEPVDDDGRVAGHPVHPIEDPVTAAFRRGLTRGMQKPLDGNPMTTPAPEVTP